MKIAFWVVFIGWIPLALLLFFVGDSHAPELPQWIYDSGLPAMPPEPSGIWGVMKTTGGVMLVIALAGLVIGLIVRGLSESKK